MPTAVFPFSLSVLASLSLAAATDIYRMDPAQSDLGFQVRYLSSVPAGRFTRFSGTIQVNERRIPESSVEVVIEAGSVDTQDEDRDRLLRGPQFFDVDKFPYITFRSSKVREAKKGKLEVTGDVTMHGVTRRITLPIAKLGAMPGRTRGVVAARFEGTLLLNRKDFDMGSYPGVVGEDVKVLMEITAVKVGEKP
jgi:polyisoprenoid-binding protein YceI